MEGPAAASPVLIVALGDSTTAGTPLYKSPAEAPPDGEGDIRSQYVYWLAERHPDWRLRNRGVNRERIAGIARRVSRGALDRNPTVAVIIAGVNDVYDGATAAEVTAALRALWDQVLEAGVPVVAGSILPYDTATPDQNAVMREVNAWIAAEAARDPRVAFVDTRAAVAAPGDPDRLASSPDGLHPDIDGHRRLAGALEPALVRVIREAAQTRRDAEP